MDRFHLLEHTADIGIEARAGTREGLAEQSGFGLRYLLFSDVHAESLTTEDIRAQGNTCEETLVNWLNELLFVMVDKGQVPAQIEVLHFTEESINARVHGEPYTSGRHQLQREIKAATHHQTSIGHDGNQWRSTVYLDL